MADVAASSPAPAVAPKTKKTTKAASGSKLPKAKPAHPPTADMVNNAIKNLKERGGSSLQAIKKYISANYKVDAEKLAPFIRKYLKAAVTSGTLVQTKGKGASGSFKLAEKAKTAAKKTTKPVAKKPKSPAKEKKPKAATTAAKKAPSAKKAVAAKKKPAAVKKPKSPSKAKKTTKAPAAAKKPKPKKVASKPKASPKKAAPKKK